MYDIIYCKFEFYYILINLGLIIFNHDLCVFIIYQTIKEDLRITFGYFWRKIKFKS